MPWLLAPTKPLNRGMQVVGGRSDLKTGINRVTVSYPMDPYGSRIQILPQKIRLDPWGIFLACSQKACHF
jgi:hypothetical protein